MLREALMAASRSTALRRVASDVPVTRRVARRFVAGEQLDEAMAVAVDLNQRGMSVSLDYLGEAVDDLAVADAACDTYLDALDRIATQQLDAAVSVKPSQLGIGLDPDHCRMLMGRIAARAADAGRHVTIDMEGPELTQATVELVVALRSEGHDNVGCAVQSSLHRTLDDVARLTALGASLRLCKGAYVMPDDIGYQDRGEIDDSFVQAADVVLRGDTFGRFATHDDRIIAQIRNLARRHQVTEDRFEFQMLYGVREPLQREIVAAGYALRIYVPFGDQWYPYLTRRLAERPANLLFFLRALAGRRG